MNYYLAQNLSNAELSDEFQRLSDCMLENSKRINAYSEYDKSTVAGKASYDCEIKHYHALKAQRQLIDNIRLEIA